MSRVSPKGTSLVQNSDLSGVGAESAALASLRSSWNSSQFKSLLPTTMSARKPVPPVSQSPVAFPVDNVSHPDSAIPFSSKRRLVMSGPSAAYKRTMSSPSPSPPLSRLIPKSPLISSDQPVAGSTASPASTLSSSLTRNSSVPASLTHNAVHDIPSSNLPARSLSASVSQPRPSLSSPSPPTPIVPSIPLRHATQRSPVQLSHFPSTQTAPSTPRTPSSAPTTISRGSLDRQSSSKKPLTEHNPSMTTFANASDPNLSSQSATATPVIEPNHCALPLKQLLAKPANPSSPFQSGSESELGSHPYYGNHARSASTTDSVQFATARPNSEISAFELAAIRALPIRSLVALNTGAGDRTKKCDYHYRRMADPGIKESEAAKKDREVRLQGEEGIGWWPDKKGGDESERKSGKDKLKDKDIEPRPRNVLRRRPNNSVIPESRNSQSDRPRLSRSLSASSLFKRANLFTLFNPNVRGVDPLPKSPSVTSGSMSPTVFKLKNDRDTHSHDNRISAQHQQHQNIDIRGHAVTSQDAATKIIPTSSPGSQQSSPRVVSPELSLLAAGHLHHGPDTRLSAISCTTTRPLSRDRYISPASVVADAYKGEQLAKEAAVSTPERPPQLPSPKLLPTLGGPEVSSHLPSTTPPASAAADGAENSQRSSACALSYAGVNSYKADVAEKIVNPAGETKEALPEGTQQPLLESAGLLVTKEFSVRSTFSPSPQPSASLAQSPQPSDMVDHSCHSSPLASPPFRTSSNEPRNRNRLRKSRHASDQGELMHSPYYTVVGSRNDQVYGVGSRRDSFGTGYSPFENTSWGVRTTITAGAGVNEGEKDKSSIGKSLSRKLSGKFKRPRSAGAIDENTNPMSRGRARIWQDGQPPLFRVGQVHSTKVTPEMPDSGDQCLPSYLYSLKKQAQSEMEFSAQEKEKEKEGGGGGGSSMFPKIRKMFGRSKSKERNEVDVKTDALPPLPALPKHYVSAVNDIYTPIYSRSDEDQVQSSRTHKSPRPRSANKTSPTTVSGHPSTATRSSTSEAPSTSVWNRTHSAHSSVSSLLEAPPMPSPLPDLTRYTTDDTDSLKVTKVSKAARTPRNMEAKAKEDKSKLERSESPPIPVFSTAEPINTFPPKRSSEWSKSSPTSSTSTPSPTSPPPPRPARSPQRPKIVDSRTNSFSDEALYPPVMNQSSRSIPKMTFRQLDSEKRKALSEQEKSARWEALLEKSDAAGGTLHFGGGEEKLASDELRFSRTLSELARDDDY